MLKIRYAQKSDMTFWLELDNHLSKAGLAKFQDQQALILTDEEEPVGIRAINCFGIPFPFVPSLVVNESQQRKGRGRHFLRLWEAEMRKQGYGMCMTSTSLMRAVSISIEKCGYKDAGGLLMDVPGFEQPLELFL